ncbi:MAG: hypothetical protein ACQESR_14445 [Planctomycetota bacterium]
MERRLRTWILAVLGFLLGVYFSVYVVLSLNGRYEPAVIGLNGVKCYAWAPRGFHANLTWRQEPLMFFAPLYGADTWLWHAEDEAHSGRYPITEVDRNNIWKYYEAEALLEESNEDGNPVPVMQGQPNASNPR